jgi:hypothetical protein
MTRGRCARAEHPVILSPEEPDEALDAREFARLADLATRPRVRLQLLLCAGDRRARQADAGANNAVCISLANPEKTVPTGDDTLMTPRAPL